MGAERSLAPWAPQEQYDDEIGAVRVQVRGDAERGTLVLTPPDGAPLQIRLENGTLTLSYDGPQVRLEAPAAHMELAAKSIKLKAETTVEVHGGKEVDIHSGEDVEVRADHHVNLWGFGVNVGD